jgi:3-hydroxyacyl-[acyl-carrier-protein] dehydratase
MTESKIIEKLPYAYPFLFVDGIIAVDENSISGHYTYVPELPFYQGHFKDGPITPGVILTETMAQIGLVCLGIYITNKESNNLSHQIAMTSNAIDFYKPVFPSEKVMVQSEKLYFRFNKLKCKVKMYNENSELVCRGTIAGMLKQ